MRISSRLLAQYPTDMTIVLQHQYWELTVTEQAFEVGLSFNGVPERLLVPFTAVRGFVDPSVQFALQFQSLPRADTIELEDSAEPIERRRPAAGALRLRRPREAPATPIAEDKSDPAAGDAQIVSLDAFRKKT